MADTKHMGDEEPGRSWGGPSLTRRSFLGVVGVGGATAYSWSLAPSAFAATQLSPSYQTFVRRREDGLHLSFDFYNLQPKTNSLGQRVLARVSATSPETYVVVRFEPQAVLDMTALDGTTPGLPMRARVSGESRLAFHVPSKVAEIPFTLAHLLTWHAWTQNVAPAAEIGVTAGTLRAPLPYETAIELPWWLLISPRKNSGVWRHTSGFPRSGRVPLWHTRYEPGTSGFVPTSPTLHAIWTRDVNADTLINDAQPATPSASNYSLTGQPFRSSLSIEARTKIVRATSRRAHQGWKPATLNKLMLSPQGGWLDTRGEWNIPDLDLVEWIHQATMGRDQFVKTAFKGHLMPFGHEATLVTVSERRIQTGGSGPTAYLFQKQFLVVTQPTRSYTSGFAVPNGNRSFPFRSIEIKTRVTPAIDAPQALVAAPAEKNFVPVVGGAPFQFAMVATDWAGKEVELTTPLAFAGEQFAYDPATAAQVVNAFNATGSGAKLPVAARTRPLRGQRVAYAPPTTPGDTAFETARMVFGAVNPIVPAGVAGDAAAFLANGQPAFFPTMVEAQVRIEAAEAIAGGSVANLAGQLPSFKVAQAFVEGQFEAAVNKGKLFLEESLTAAAADLIPAGELAGALATPSMTVAGVSALLGPVGGDLAAIANGTFDPAAFFAGNLPKLLGSIDLSVVAKPVTDLANNLPRAMKVTSKMTETHVRTELNWEPELGDDTVLHVFKASRQDAGGATLPATLKINSVVLTDKTNPTKSSYTVDGDLRNFTLDLLGTGPLRTLELRFSRLAFHAATGEKPSVDIDIDKVNFHGVLLFVVKLQQYLKSKGIRIDVSGSGIQADLDLALPNISLGALCLKNVRLGGGLSIPFDGQPVRTNFSFSTREDPFVLTVSMFGGGGFIGMRMGGERIEMFEASLEFGATASLDFGVASGSVHLMAGVYFKLEHKALPASGGQPAVSGDTVNLSAFVRLGGEVDVLGLISVSIELYLELGYESAGNRLYGRGTLTVEIDVTLYSKTVEIVVERTFAGSEPPAAAARGTNPAALAAAPTIPVRSFEDLVPSLDDWTAYADAFA